MSRIAVKVTPKSSRDALRGWMGETLRISVTAAPERGRANQAAEALLARVLDLPAARVHVVAGHTGSRKQVEIEGMELDELRSRLHAAAPPPV